MEPFRGGDLEITVVETDTPPRLILRCEGRSIERDPSKTVGTYLDAARTLAAERGAAIEMRCQKLTYINSGTISCLVEFIRRCSQHHVGLTLCFDGKSPWQRTCFNALRVLAQDRHLTIVET